MFFPLGIELSEINDQWHEYLKKTYFPEISNKEKLTDFSRRLTNHKKLENNYNIAPAISPDGSKIAIYSNKSGNMGLYLLSIETGVFSVKGLLVVLQLIIKRNNINFFIIFFRSFQRLNY